MSASLAAILDLAEPLPEDPIEALLAVRAKVQRLAQRIHTVMSTLYPDFEACVDQLSRTEAELSTLLHAQPEGEA